MSLIPGDALRSHERELVAVEQRAQALAEILHFLADEARAGLAHPDPQLSSCRPRVTSSTPKPAPPKSSRQESRSIDDPRPSHEFNAQSAVSRGAAVLWARDRAPQFGRRVASVTRAAVDSVASKRKKGRNGLHRCAVAPAGKGSASQGGDQ